MDRMSELALATKAGTKSLDSFIAESKGFIISTTNRATHKFITESDDEFSIALNAFHEAIGAYDEGKGEFYPFAALVIKRRLTDDLRKKPKDILISPEQFSGVNTGDEESENAYVGSVSTKVADLAKEQAAMEDEKRDIKDEIAEATEALAKYGFSFIELTECSPKSAKTKEACKTAVVALLRPGELYEQMRSTKMLPIKELVAATGVQRKQIERHRKYIMAVAELLQGDFPHLNEYLYEIRKELMQK